MRSFSRFFFFFFFLFFTAKVTCFSSLAAVPCRLFAEEAEIAFLRIDHSINLDCSCALLNGSSWQRALVSINPLLT